MSRSHIDPPKRCRAMRRGDAAVVGARVLDGFPASAVEFLQCHDELHAGAIDDLVESFVGGGWGWLMGHMDVIDPPVHATHRVQDGRWVCV